MENFPDAGQFSQEMDNPDLPVHDSDGSASSEEFIDQPFVVTTAVGSNFGDLNPDHPQLSTAPMTIASSPPAPIGLQQWPAAPTTRSRGSSLSSGAAAAAAAAAVAERPESSTQRPSGPARTPSNTYAPQRRPPHYANVTTNIPRSSSVKRSSRRDPNAQYRAQEKAYVQRIRNNPRVWSHHSYDISAESDLEEPSPSSELQFEDDPYDPDTQLFLADDNQPTIEELKNPKNQERLEWHSMLASVLKGDVVKQEKKRLIGATESKPSSALNNEIWIGARARTCGRTIALQTKLIEEARSGLGPLIEDVVSFEIKGEAEIGIPPIKQVEDIMEKIGNFELLYPTQKDLEIAYPRVASEEFCSSFEAIVSWHNTTVLINTELAILRSWVGNSELDFGKPRSKPLTNDISDETSFLDRIMKEDGLKTLQGDHSMLNGISSVIQKAKSTLIQNAEAFSKRHLPPYIEELLTLINFPSRLIEEIIRMRLSYARNMKDPAQQSPILVDQMIYQFQILMKVAAEIKQDYLGVSRPEPGWDLPPCIDENFDTVVLDAMRYYFRLLNWKLSANKNTFKEAEILEQDWEFSNTVGRQLDGGDIEVAEQFR